MVLKVDINQIMQVPSLNSRQNYVPDFLEFPEFQISQTSQNSPFAASLSAACTAPIFTLYVFIKPWVRKSF